jgi:peroxiredoxin Q/BCP
VQARGAVVLGVSPDNIASHEKFRDKFSLPFPLLADEDHAVAEAYGAWGEKSMYGRKYQGILRTTFIIDPAGRIAHVFEKVKPMGHAAEVLDALASGASAP